MIQEFILKNLITIVFIILLIYGFIKGFGEGFLKKILSFGSLILTIVLTKMFTPIVSNMVKDFTNIEATLSDMVYSLFIKSNAYDKINLEGLGKIINTGDIGGKIKENLCNGIANAIINLLCGIGVFIITLIIIKIIIKVLDIIDYIPMVGQFNKLLGGITGAFEIVVVLWIIFTILTVLSSVPQVEIFVKNIQKSYLVGFLYDNNPVYNFFSNLFLMFKKS